MEYSVCKDQGSRRRRDFLRLHVDLRTICLGLGRKSYSYRPRREPKLITTLGICSIHDLDGLHHWTLFTPKSRPSPLSASK